MKFEFLQNPYKARASTSHHPGETCKNINMDDINSRIIFLLNRFGYLNQLIASAICNSGKVKHNSHLKVKAAIRSCCHCIKHKCTPTGGTYATPGHFSFV